ncbi:MAG: type II toxin-antitoxin system RelE/ParE family toxin [Ignavibacteriales bacterium]|nr:type II toxin-antitoxin system RelE/ParE family toxin [Ignavibacteriales bacterium]
MNTIYRKIFLKDLSKTPIKTRKQIEEFVFHEILKMSNVTESKKIEKMKGHLNCYKIRFGDYRLGIKIDKDKLIFERILHRKDIYKYFPK